jgi:hypothetical protein
MLRKPVLWYAAAVVTGAQSANVVGSPGQAALASAINNGQGVPPGSPITSESSAFTTNAPAFASSISGRKLKQVHQLAITTICDTQGVVPPLETHLHQSCSRLLEGQLLPCPCTKHVTALLKSSCCDEVVAPASYTTRKPVMLQIFRM